MPAYRRLFVLALFLAAVAFILVPGMLADRVEREFRLLTALAAENHAIDLTVTDYQRNWFTARARSELRIDLDKGEMVVPLHHTIRHGPTIPGLQLARIDSAIATEDSQGIPDHRIRLDIGLTGNAHLQARLARGTLALDGGNLSHNGGNADLRLNRNQSDYELRAEWPHLDIQENGQSLLLFEALQLNSHGELKNEAAEPFWNGASTLHIGNLMVRGDSPHGDLTLAEARLDVTQSSHDNTVRLSHGGSFKSLQVAELDAGNGHYQLELDGLDRLVWDEFQQRVNAIQGQALSVEESEARIQRALIETLPEFLAGQPRLELSRFEVETAAGRIDASLTLGLEEAPNDVRAAGIFALLNRVEGDGAIRMPEASLRKLLMVGVMREVRASTGNALGEARMEQVAGEMVGQQIRQMKGMAILEEVDDTMVRTRFGLKNGTLLVNGEEYMRLF